MTESWPREKSAVIYEKMNSLSCPSLPAAKVRHAMSLEGDFGEAAQLAAVQLALRS